MEKKISGQIKHVANPFLEVGQLVEEALILRSRASDDSVENGARVEDLLLVHAVPHLPSSSLSRLIICQYYLFKWFDIIWTEELPILGPPLFCLHDGSGHGLSTTPCFVDGLGLDCMDRDSRLQLCCTFGRAPVDLNKTTLANTFVFILDGYVSPIDICCDWQRNVLRKQS